MEQKLLLQRAMGKMKEIEEARRDLEIEWRELHRLSSAIERAKTVGNPKELRRLYGLLRNLL